MRRSQTVAGDTETTIGILLRTGVALSGAVVLLGAVAFLLRHGHRTANYGVFHGAPAGLRHVVDIMRAALAFDSRGIMQLGLLILIATPVARVILSIWDFARERDRSYVVIAAVVLCTLLYSLVYS